MKFQFRKEATVLSLRKMVEPGKKTKKFFCKTCSNKIWTRRQVPMLRHEYWGLIWDRREAVHRKCSVEKCVVWAVINSSVLYFVKLGLEEVLLMSHVDLTRAFGSTAVHVRFHLIVFWTCSPSPNLFWKFEKNVSKYAEVADEQNQTEAKIWFVQRHD